MPKERVVKGLDSLRVNKAKEANKEVIQGILRE